jgi:hypothetical protein
LYSRFATLEKYNSQTEKVATMSNQTKVSDILNEKVTNASFPEIPEEDLKNGGIVVIDEEEKAILKKIDLQ